jgi:hypothetical protein
LVTSLVWMFVILHFILQPTSLFLISSKKNYWHISNTCVEVDKVSERKKETNNIRITK